LGVKYFGKHQFVEPEDFDIFILISMCYNAIINYYHYHRRSSDPRSGVLITNKKGQQSKRPKNSLREMFHCVDVLSRF